ncbi:hypothetical protein ACTFIW_011073 [Dictyostelium discoideum]
MLTSIKIKTDDNNNNNKIFQDIIDFEILKSIINYLLTSKKNKNNNSNQYKICKFYYNINEILNYTLVSKKWYNFISLTISNNIINNKSFEYWLNIDYKNKSFFENYNNRNQYDKSNLFFNCKQNEISFNKDFSIIKIKESIINDYFKFNLFVHNISIYNFMEIKNKFENNQLLYNRIVVNFRNIHDQNYNLFMIDEYVSNENSEIISNLFKILELNYNLSLPGGNCLKSKENKKYTEIYLNNLSINSYDKYVQVGKDRETAKVFNVLKGKNLIYKRSGVETDIPTHINCSALFDPHNSGQQVESIKVIAQSNYEESVEVRHLMKVNQFENLHSITIPINSFLILSNLSEEMGFHSLYRNIIGNSENMKSELNQMINSFITCKSLKNLKITPVNSKHLPIYYKDFAHFDGGNHETFINKLNETIESFSNSFKPLFSELNTSIERIEFDCMGLLNINTFSNLLNNKSIKYLYLYGNSDFIVYSSKLSDNGGDGDDYELHSEPISINQYLFDNIFTSPLTSIRHYKIRIKELKQIKLIFNLILNNIFKLQLYSLIFEIYDNELDEESEIENQKELIGEFVKEFKNLINNISIQQQEQHQKSNNITLIEIKIKIERYKYKYIQELNNINNPYFTTILEN